MTKNKEDVVDNIQYMKLFLNGIEESVKEDINEINYENINIYDVNKNDEIVNFNGYIFWRYVEKVMPFIKNYLRTKFPNSLILHEFNRIDIIVLDEEIPIEIQTTRYISELHNADFEDRIRRQIEDNIENYGKCWFFLMLSITDF